jgi:hypothetical protein
MLMGRLPGSQALPLTNAYSGAQRFASAPLQPYPLPQPVPRPPVMPQLPAPAATLPAAIEAWRRHLLAMQPWQLMQQFGMPPAQVRQMLSEPQTATLLYQQSRNKRGAHPDVNRHGGGSGFGNVDTPESRDRLVGSLRAGFSENPMGIVDAARNLVGLAKNPMGTLAGTAVDAILGIDEGRFGLHGVRGHRKYSQEVVQAARAGRVKTRAQADRLQAEIDNARGKIMSDSATRAHAGGRGANASGGGRGRSAAGPGGRGPAGGGAYGGRGGVGSHGV